MPHGADFDGAAAAVAGVPELRAELRLRRHLLEQPPSPVPGRRSTSTAAILWANLHLLFWLSLVAVRHRLDGREPLRRRCRWPSTACVLLLCGDRLLHPVAASLLAHHGRDSPLARAIGRDFKGKISVVLYAVAIPLAFVQPVARVRALRRWSRSCGSSPTGASSARSQRTTRRAVSSVGGRPRGQRGLQVLHRPQAAVRRDDRLHGQPQLLDLLGEVDEGRARRRERAGAGCERRSASKTAFSFGR